MISLKLDLKFFLINLFQDYHSVFVVEVYPGKYQPIAKGERGFREAERRH